MKKLIYPDSNSSLFNAVDGTMVSIIRDTNFYGNIKKASSSAISRQLLEDCKPDKDHFLIHITALGDDETYGFNKNADGFPKKANEKYYKTFETNANLFREHNSSSPKNRIGIIKAAAYNPDMHRVEVVAWGNIKKAAAEYEAALAGKPLSSSMGCFPAGTKITLSNSTYKNIEDIALGDSVVTKSLDKSLVTKLYQYDYSGVLYGLKIAGKSDALRLTSEHPVFIRRYNPILIKDTKTPQACPVCGEPMRYLWTHLNRTKDSLHQNYLKDVLKLQEKYLEDWVPASDIKLGDYVATKIPQAVTQIYTERDLKFCRFLGYFIAEGNYIKYRGKQKVENPFRAVQLNFNINEDDYVSDVVDLLSYLVPGCKITVQKRPFKNICVISMYNKDFAYEVFKACGEYAHNKCISSNIMQMPDDCIKELINSYIKGDGTYSKFNDTITYTTVSRILSYQLELLFARLGIVVNSYSRDTYKDKRGNVHSKFYTSTVSNRFRKLATWIEKQEISSLQDKNLESYRTKSFIENGFLFRKVDAITIESVENIKVYNLEIAEDPSYIADSIVVHNCSVVHDRDNISGKLSKNPSEYEPWMKRFPCKFIEEWDGKPIKKWAYVHNDEPTFFDLSIVAKPADRIADYLEYRFNKDSDKPAVKIASENPEHIPSAYLPELLGYDLTKFGSEINRMKGDLNNFFNNKKKVSVLNKLASMEKEYIDINSNTDKSQDPRVNYIKTARYTNFDKSFKLSESDIQQLKELRPETLFFELKKRASVLPFNAFVDLIYNGYPKFASEEQKDRIVKYAEIAIVPTVFSEVKDAIENDGCLPCGDSADGLFDAGDPLEVAYDLNNTDPVQKIMDGIEEKLSLKDDKKQQRIIQITIIQGVPSDSEEKDNCGKFFKIKEASVKPEMELTSSEKNTAKQLAFSYAFYKIAAIADIFADNIPEISLIDTISQNFLAV